MSIKQEDLIYENKRLESVAKLIDKKISDLGQELYDKEEKQEEFKKFIWDSKTDMDPTELRSIMTSSDLEVMMMMQKGKYFRRLYRIQNNPYFGSIIFNEDNNCQEIYLGITYLDDEENHLIYDWRSPVCSLFYDYEIGPCSYLAPEGKISGELKRKRQYKIENRKLKHIFDNSINIDDELLQEVLANESTEKMKNIVNTIQQEQNQIIRNVTDNNLIVEGIAGSGKTSVALHRIAFLLYKIKNLNANNVLIFSPNNIFTEYISNVLPELGEDNTMQTTFGDFLSKNILEYRNVENFTSFIERYYTDKLLDVDLIKYKQSDEIVLDIDKYLNDYKNNIYFTKDIIEEDLYEYSIDELNKLFNERYSHMYVFDRIDIMATKFSEQNYEGSHKYVSSFQKKIMDSINIKKNYKEIYGNFFKSDFCKIKLSDKEIKSFVNKIYINYEDALLFTYIKGQLEGFDYNNQIEQIVIDEAQDYTRLQYLIINKIFKHARYTILGDTNQTINPYYKYNSLNELNDIFSGDSKFLELKKTYRSTKEIIDYTNKILGLSHVSAIRRENDNPVIVKNGKNLKQNIINDIKSLESKYKYIAIITKDNCEQEELYNLIKDNINISLINKETEKFNKNLIIIPAYIAKGLEFDAVIIYKKDKVFAGNEKYLYYVACTRAQHELIIYNNIN